MKSNKKWFKFFNQLRKKIISADDFVDKNDYIEIPESIYEYFKQRIIIFQHLMKRLKI